MKTYSKSSYIKSGLGVFLFLVLATMFFSKNVLSSGFRINEVSFQNNDGNDWVEIYNKSFNARTLKGMYLTDDKADFKRYEIKEDIVVPPRGFVVLYGKDAVVNSEDEGMRINFNIKNGETLYLLDQRERLLDSLTVIDDENTTDDITIGLFPDGAELSFTLTKPTPGEQNKKEPLSVINSKL